MAGPLKPVKPGVSKPRDAIKKLKLLLYGHFGVGKTFFIGSAAWDPELFGRILILCPDPGALTLAFDDRMNEQIDVAAVSSTSDLDTWYEWLRVEMPKLPQEERYGTLAIDGFTDLGEMALKEALDTVHAKDSTRDPDMPGVDHWNRVGIELRREIRRFRDLPLTFIATALAKQLVATDGKIYTTPSVAGKLAAELGAYVDVVGYLETKKNKDTGVQERRLRVQPTEYIVAKDRTRKLGEIVVNPTLGNIVRRINDASVEQGPILGGEAKIELPKMAIKPKDK